MGLFVKDTVPQHDNKIDEIKITAMNYLSRVSLIENQRKTIRQSEAGFENKLEIAEDKYKETFSELKENIHSLKQEFFETKHKIMNLAVKMNSYAKKGEIERLQDFVDGLSISEFITREEMKQLIRERLSL